MGVAPTGKLITVSGISIIRIANSKIAEEWTSRDDLGMMQQLGLARHRHWQGALSLHPGCPVEPNHSTTSEGRA